MRNSHDPRGVISEGSKAPDIEMQGRLPRDARSPQVNEEAK